MIDQHPSQFLTVSGIAAEVGLPSSTVVRRLEKLGITPDAELLRGHETPSPLFLGTRLGELVENLKSKPE